MSKPESPPAPATEMADCERELTALLHPVKNSHDSSSPERRPHLRKWLLILGATVLLALGAYFATAHALNRWLESRALRSRIASKTGQELGGQSGYLPLSWRGRSVYSEGLLATASPPRALTELRAHQIYARCNLIELWHGQFRIDELTVAEAEAAFGKAAAGALTIKLPTQPELAPPATEETPFSVEIRKVVITRTGLDWGDEPEARGSFRDVTTTYLLDGRNLAIHGKGGVFKQTNWPEAEVSSLKLYYAKPQLRVDEASLTLGGKSLLGVTGKLNFGEQGAMDLQLHFQHCPVSPFLPENSRAKLEGSFESKTRLQKKFGGKSPVQASGQVEFADAVLRNIEGLEKIAAFTSQREFARPTLEQLSASFQWDAPKLSVEDLAIEDRGLFRVEGAFSVRENEIDGTLKVGTTAAVLESFPGAREEVFTREQDGYFWTTVRVTGPLKKPRDDLKPRLVEAAKKHFAKKFLAPIFKPGATIIEKIEDLF